MPDKDNENKFMAMLERMGMVRKIDSDDEQENEIGEAPGRQAVPYSYTDDEYTEDIPPRQEEILGGSFGAPRQPIPGMPEPVLPAEKQQAETRREPEPEEIPIPRKKAEEIPLSRKKPEEIPISRKKPEENRGYRFDQSFWDEPVENNNLPIEAYADRFLEMEELYGVFSMKTSGTDTVYLVEEYLKTLPDSLPDESRREIIVKIIAASGFDYDNLMGDGVARVGKLKEYAEQFAQRTEEYISSRNAELDSLERQMEKVRNMIDRRRELHKKQFFAIEAEAQRLRDILGFLSE